MSAIKTRNQKGIIGGSEEISEEDTVEVQARYDSGLNQGGRSGDAENCLSRLLEADLCWPFHFISFSLLSTVSAHRKRQHNVVDNSMNDESSVRSFCPCSATES